MTGKQRVKPGGKAAQQHALGVDDDQPAQLRIGFQQGCAEHHQQCACGAQQQAQGQSCAGQRLAPVLANGLPAGEQPLVHAPARHGERHQIPDLCVVVVTVDLNPDEARKHDDVERAQQQVPGLGQALE